MHTLNLSVRNNRNLKNNQNLKDQNMKSDKRLESNKLQVFVLSERFGLMLYKRVEYKLADYMLAVQFVRPVYIQYEERVVPELVLEPEPDMIDMRDMFQAVIYYCLSNLHMSRCHTHHKSMFAVFVVVVEREAILVTVYRHRNRILRDNSADDNEYYY